ISAVEARTRTSDGLVATVGKVDVTPNANNVIAGSVRVSLDVRHPHDAQRLGAVEDLLASADKIAGRRKLALQSTRTLDQPAVAMDECLTAYMTEAIEAAGFAAKQMHSGAGHDAMVIAERMPAAMLFLRSPGGISHSPGEAVRDEDVEAALAVSSRFLERLAGAIG
ncbi:MAG: M20/M25/M40 family metallo-hydrolase, partial [Terracidiphilus sp.]